MPDILETPVVHLSIARPIIPDLSEGRPLIYPPKYRKIPPVRKKQTSKLDELPFEKWNLPPQDSGYIKHRNTGLL